MWWAAVLLAVAIVIEVGASALLPRTQGFTEPAWTALVLAGYAVSIGLLAVIVRSIPVSVTYATWSGAGTALVAIAGVAFLGERLGLLQVVGLTAIVGGVVALNLQPH